MHLEQGRAPRRSFQKRAIAAVAALFAVSFSAVALAEPDFPGELQKAIKMPCAPTCMLCHTDPEGGPDKLNDFYGDVLAFKGGGGDKTLDKDGDGKSNYDELIAGESPLIPGNPSVCIPEYGCGARVAKAPTHGQLQSEGLLFGAIGFGVLLRWQLRRRSADRR
jgi:hypothetical protein